MPTAFLLYRAGRVEVNFINYGEIACSHFLLFSVAKEPLNQYNIDIILIFVMLESVFYGTNVTVDVEGKGEGEPGHHHSVL
jgi:hypothetical protein